MIAHSAHDAIAPCNSTSNGRHRDVRYRNGEQVDPVEHAVDCAEKAVATLPVVHAMHVKRADIDGLRGIAVLLVVLFHAKLPGWWAFSGGFIGVDVFFVLSGYLVTLVLLRELLHVQKFCLLKFYSRRICRLLPMSMLVLFLVCAYSQAFSSAAETQILAADARAAALNWANYHFLSRHSNYFDATSGVSWVLHYWSLSVEEQFYFVWPLLLCGCAWLPEKYRLLATVSAASLITVLSWMFSWIASGDDKGLAYFSSFSRIWAMTVGAALAIYHCDAPIAQTDVNKAETAGNLLGKACHVSALILLIFCSLFFDEDVRFPGASAVVPVACTLIILHQGRSEPTVNPAAVYILSSRVFVHFGNISYSLYLWHWPALRIVDVAPSLASFTPLRRCCIALAIAYCLSVLTVRFVENKIRYSRAPHYVVFGTAICSVVGIILYTICLGAPLISTPFLDGRMEELGLRSFPANATLGYARSPEFQTLASSDMKSMLACHTVFSSKSTHPRLDCEGGDTNSTVTVVLTGDSHTIAYIPAVHIACKHLGVRLRFFSKGGCPLFDMKADPAEIGCDGWRTAVWAQLRKEFNRENPFDLLLHIRSTNGIHKPSALAVYKRKVTELLERIGSEGLGKRVVLLRDNPWASREKESCMKGMREDFTAGITPRPCDFPVTESGLLDQQLWSIDQDIASTWTKAPAVNVTDLTDALCPGGFCKVFDPESRIVMYNDWNHLYAGFVMRTWPHFMKEIAMALGMSTPTI